MSRAFTHIDRYGKAVMVNVQHKAPSLRVAVAQCIVKTPPHVFNAVVDKKIEKGDIFTVAKMAGISGAKQTSSLIPLCHPLPVDFIDVEITPEKYTSRFFIKSRVVSFSKTGVEMEALMSASIAGLTFYDMCKALSHEIVLSDIMLLEKMGGKTKYIRKEVKDM